MNGVELFKAKGWEIHYRRTKVVAVDPNGKDYPICQKYWGGTDYDKEIIAAYKDAIKQDLILP